MQEIDARTVHRRRSLVAEAGPPTGRCDRLQRRVSSAYLAKLLRKKVLRLPP
jgi:hypothetical protein